MKKSYWLAALLALAVSGEVWAQGIATTCREVSHDTTIQGPTRADSVKIADVDGHVVDDLSFVTSAGQWTPDEPAIGRIQAVLAKGDVQRPELRLLWFAGSDRIQTDQFWVSGEDSKVVCASKDRAEAPPHDDVESFGDDLDPEKIEEIRSQCKTLWRRWNSAIESRLGHERYLAILFGSDGQVIEENKDYGVAGDLIYTAVCQQQSPQAPIVTFTKCDLQSAIPKSPEGTEVVVPQAAEETKAQLIEYPVRQCFGDSAEISFKLGSIDEMHTIGLYERYRYTLQVGALSTDQHPHSFGLRPDGDDKRIFDQGPIDKGPEYVASVVLYALPRYLGSLVQRQRQGKIKGLEALATRTYQGRDVVNDHALADRIGLVVGVGLDHPRDRFAFGLSFELIPGVNVVGVYEWAKLKDLAGVAEGDVFAGTAEEIPTREVWQNQAVVGLSLDLRYVAGLFKRGT